MSPLVTPRLDNQRMALKNKMGNKMNHPNEEIKRNFDLLNDIAQGMYMIDVVVKYRISSSRIYEIIKRAKEKKAQVIHKDAIDKSK